MNTSRRTFLRSTGLGGMALAFGRVEAAGPDNSNLPQIAAQARRPHAAGFNMCGYAAPKIDTVRIGLVGVGKRGIDAVGRLKLIDGVELRALCDVRPERVALGLRELEGTSHRPREYAQGPDAWKAMCASADLDLIYICTPWALHTPIAVFAMEHGKHVAVEVPAAKTVDECWQLVETSERTRRHCRMLENCCYDFFELLTLNLARQGFFGDIVHGEGAYLHHNAASLFDKAARYDMWRLKENAARNGNLYPTHGLGPICQIMNVNRGDRLDYLTSVSSDDFGMGKKARELARTDPDFQPFARATFRGNHNASIIRTKHGRTITLQHDITTPQPYSRIHAISGTHAFAVKYPEPPRIAVGEEWLTPEEFKKIEERYTFDLVKKMGDTARKVGGHGGMDFLMDWRLISQLRGGVALDHDVYDAATWSVISPLSEWSVANRSSPIDVPDFTRGNWEKNAPVDMARSVALSAAPGQPRRKTGRS